MAPKVNIEAEISKAAMLGTQLEFLVYEKGKAGKLIAVGKNDDLVMGYWSMIFDYGKGVGCNLQFKFFASAFALLRPIVEALVRAGIVLGGSPEWIAQIRQGRFNISYEKDGARLDADLGTSPLLEDFLKETRGLMHSLAHSGTAQLGMMFDGEAVGSNATDDQQLALIGVASNSLFLMTVMIAKHFGFEDVAESANKIFWEYGKDTWAAASLKS